MSDTSADTRSDAELSREIAQGAGQLLLQLRADWGSLEDKDSANALRKAGDRAAHEFIVERLAAARPADAILSEEGKDDEVRLGHERVWIVDPLDGTYEFGQGRADFAVHIALWHASSKRLSACTVDLPAQQLTRTMDDPGHDWVPMPIDRPIRIVASRSRPPATLPRTLERLSAMLRESGINEHGCEVMDVGSVGAKVNELLCGRAEAYLHDTGFYEWDVAAPYGVADAYGLVHSHVDGTDITFNHMPPYVTSLMVAHPAIAPLLREAMADA